MNIERGAYFGRGDKVEIGDYSGIGIFCTVYDNIVIGNNVMMGPYCFCVVNNSHIIDRTDVPMQLQGRRNVIPKVVIGSDVWIGRETLILGNREIKDGTVIGARTVLCKDFPEYSIIGGNPSKLIRSRK